MLITCPECNNNISDKATSCPHCGYPMRISLNNADSYDIILTGYKTKNADELDF